MARYSETVMDHFQSPRNHGRIQDPDGVGVAGVPGRGPFLILNVRVEQDTVSEAKFLCHGCGATIAAGSVLTELIIGRSVAACRELTKAQLLDALDGLPPDKQHCAGFAIQALHQALDDLTASDLPEKSESKP